ncbi:metalloproteinase inhibitor 2-like [Mercenaria mercenaria]|uniref:metalloproteinase inhibitor 2-like n=1 Tax=Mercenaria mercenaria TaxID=6596 RepID=UPI00234F9619|nr:metalloproteinase inhibitor 2-like [Mercenaria mercenaria]
METKILLGFLVFATLCHLGYSCSCLPMSFTKKYCDADFVAKVRVRSNLKNPSGQQDFNDFYKIRRIGAPWKGSVKRRTRVYTASNDAMCGVYLQKGKKYLLAGNMVGNKLRINLCSSIYERTPLSRQIRKMKKNRRLCIPTIFNANKFRAARTSGK